MARHHVLLVPGFFAFADLGELRYWSGVDAELARAFADLGLDADLTELETLPTASIRIRAGRVLEAIESIAREHDGPIHVVGHSTGGLDARLAISPHADLGSSFDVAAARDAQARVASLVTIATPHRGTPLAALFGSAMGRPLLGMLSSAAIFGLQRGEVPLSLLLRIGSLITRLDDLLGLERTMLDQLYSQLLSDFDELRREALIGFLAQVKHDRALIVQLEPDSLDLFNATTADPTGVAHGSVITAAKPPTVRHALAHYADPYAQGLHLLFGLLWLLTARFDKRHVPALSSAQESALATGLGQLPAPRDNDGIVPTYSQVWGEVIHATWADHLDVVGQYGEIAREGIHSDWLPSASGFTGKSSRALWRDVAAFVTRAARARDA